MENYKGIDIYKRGSNWYAKGYWYYSTSKKEILSAIEDLLSANKWEANSNRAIQRAN